MAHSDNRYSRRAAAKESSGRVHVRGAREHNLKNLDVDIPRDSPLQHCPISCACCTPARRHPDIVVDHDMRVVAGSDWVIDIGPGAGEEGGTMVVAGPPAAVARAKGRTAPYLARFLDESVSE